jgi:hypothetical protein
MIKGATTTTADADADTVPTTHTKMAAQPLPDLRLWDHAAVAFPRARDGNGTKRDVDVDVDVDLVVFGGYGEGPSLLPVAARSKTSPSPKRSNAIYCLRRRNWTFAPHWTQLQLQSVPIVVGDNHNKTTSISTFTPRQGLAACSSSRIGTRNSAMIFGGRESPSKPLNDLFLYHHQDGSLPSTLQMVPKDATRGTPPSPRWGHTLTALPSTLSSQQHQQDDGTDTDETDEVAIAILVGGRNATQALSDIHVLSIIIITGASGSAETQVQVPVFQWSKVIRQGQAILERPLFHHATTVLKQSQNENKTENNNDVGMLLFIFGGLSEPPNDDLLQVVRSRTPAPATVAYRITKQASQDFTLEHVPLLLPSQQQQQQQHDVVCGAATCAWQLPSNNDTDNDYHHVLVAGGTSSGRTSSSSSGPFSLLKLTTEKDTIVSMAEMDYVAVDVGEQEHARTGGDCWNAGSMVHHCCLTLPDDDDDDTLSHYDHSSSASTTAVGGIIQKNNKKQQQVFVLGGGVQAFAFGPSYGKCYALQIR